MADAYEDTIRVSPGGGSGNGARRSTSESPENSENEYDEDELAVDFRALSLSAQTSLPKRGTKDFEPNPTLLQRSTLAASRQAMHDALSHTRMHNPRAKVTGVFDWQTGLTRVKQIRGSMFRTVGKDVSGGGVDLLPEEALWALESGRLDIRWPVDAKETAVEDGSMLLLLQEESSRGVDTGEAKEEAEHEGVSMSLQGAYATYLADDTGDGWLTLEKYLVYAGLKRCGYIVERAEEAAVRSQTTYTSWPSPSSSSQNEGFFESVLRDAVTAKMAMAEERRRIGAPLVAPGLYRSFNDIYSLLRLIPSAAPPTSLAPSAYTAPTPALAGQDDNIDMSIATGMQKAKVQREMITHFHVYKPSGAYRKPHKRERERERARQQGQQQHQNQQQQQQQHQQPDFRVCVVSAQDTGQDTDFPFVPTLEEVTGLLDRQHVPSALASESAYRLHSGDADAETHSQQQQQQAPTQTQMQTHKTRKRANINDTYRFLKTSPHAGRNVLLAVVQDGVVSYMRVSEAAFASRPLYASFDDDWDRAHRSAAAQHHGGGKGARGRGRGAAAARGRAGGNGRARGRGRGRGL